MKIKEKGLTGRAAQARRESLMGASKKAFNAFRELDKTNKKATAEEKKKPEVYLEFMGARVRVHEDEEGKGVVKQEDLPLVRGACLRFEGVDGEVTFDDIKVN